MDELLNRPPMGDRFFVSYLTLLEVTASIVRRARRPKGPIAVDGVLRQFSRDLLRALTVWPLDEHTIRRSTGAALTYGLRSGDAIQLTTALDIAETLGAASLYVVSADKELLAAASTEGLPTIDPTAADAIATLRQIRAGG